jgi:hypothetical protein
VRSRAAIGRLYWSAIEVLFSGPIKASARLPQRRGSGHPWAADLKTLTPAVLTVVEPVCPTGKCLAQTESSASSPLTLASFDLESVGQPEVVDCLFQIANQLLRLCALKFECEAEPKSQIDAGLELRDQFRA